MKKGCAEQFDADLPEGARLSYGNGWCLEAGFTDAIYLLALQKFALLQPHCLTRLIIERQLFLEKSHGYLAIST
jgi:hypothetical protein